MQNHVTHFVSCPQKSVIPRPQFNFRELEGGFPQFPERGGAYCGLSVTVREELAPYREHRWVNRPNDHLA
jgi:hypothetical protein